MISCTNKKSNNDEIIPQYIDSLNYYREIKDNKKMFYYIDTLKALRVKMPDIAMEYAVAYAHLKQYDKAIQILKDNISSSSKPQLLYNEMGNIYLIKGDTANAILSYKQAINCNPNYARPYIYLANIYKENNEKELAINNYLAAIRLFAENEYYEEMGNLAMEILEIDSTNLDAIKFLQYYCYNEKDYKTALAIGFEIDEICVKQNKLDEGYVNMYFMGMILYDMGEYEKSISLMHQASENDITAKEYGYSICCYTSASYRKLRDNEKADYFLSLAKEVDKDNAEKYINDLLNRNNGNK